MNLVLQTKSESDDPPIVGPGGVILLTPPVSEDYWAYRVDVGGGQAIVGFPKFTTIGIGFAIEDDWNTNLPYSVPAVDIWAHIDHNKGPATATDEECIAAIELIRQAVIAERGPIPESLAKGHAETRRVLAELDALE